MITCYSCGRPVDLWCAESVPVGDGARKCLAARSARRSERRTTMKGNASMNKNGRENLPLIAGRKGFLTLKGVSYMSDGMSVTYEGAQSGFKTEHHIFRARSGWRITVSERDFSTGEAAFTAEPQTFFNRTQYHKGGRPRKHGGVGHEPRL